MLYSNAYLAEVERALGAALPAWGLSQATSLDLLTISENVTFLARDLDGRPRLILRVHRPDYHSTAEILSELAWIAELRSDAVVETPRPVPTTDGQLIVELALQNAVRHAVAFDFAEGKEPDQSDDLAVWYGHLGEITARLHHHARNWQRPADFIRKRWTFDTIIGSRPYWGDWRSTIGLQREEKAVLESTSRRLGHDTETYGGDPDRFGLIHADLRAANLLVRGSRMTVIDFDDCGFSWFAYDFAAAVSFMEHLPIIPDLMQSWIDGYRRVTPFSRADAKALPMFVMLRRMQLTAWIASHSETPTAREMAPDYLAGTLLLADAYLSKPDRK